MVHYCGVVGFVYDKLQIMKNGVNSQWKRTEYVPLPAGKNIRMSYSRQKEVLEMPNLIEVQKDSYKWFLDEGLKEVFDDISPIADYSGSLKSGICGFRACAKTM